MHLALTSACVDQVLLWVLEKASWVKLVDRQSLYAHTWPDSDLSSLNS